MSWLRKPGGWMRNSENEERREHPRVCVEDTHSASVLGEAATPIDISATGILLEVSRALSGFVNRLKLDLGLGQELLLQGKVARCYVHRFEPSEDDRLIIKYGVAIEFMNLNLETRLDLQSYVDAVTKKEIAKDIRVGVAYEGLESERCIEANNARSDQGAFFMDSVERVAFTTPPAEPIDLLQLTVGGMLVSPTSALPVGSLHRFALTVDGWHIAVQGEVLYCKSETDEENFVVHTAAIKFRGLSLHDKERLEQYVMQVLGEHRVEEFQESA